MAKCVPGKRHDETDGYLELTSGISFGDVCDVSLAPDCLGRADDSRKSSESSWVLLMSFQGRLQVVSVGRR